MEECCLEGCCRGEEIMEYCLLLFKKQRMIVKGKYQDFVKIILMGENIV